MSIITCNPWQVLQELMLHVMVLISFPLKNGNISPQVWVSLRVCSWIMWRVDRRAGSKKWPGAG